MRLVGLLLAGPLVLGAFGAPFFVGQMDFGLVLAMICAVMASAWAIVVLFSSRISMKLAGLLGLGLAGLSLGAMALMAGLASPIMLLLFALPLEAWWVSRERQGVKAGLIAAACVLGLTALASQFLPGQGPTPQAWHWIFPLSYLGLVGLRAKSFLPKAAAADVIISDFEQMADCPVLRIDAGGEVIAANGLAEILFGTRAPHLAGTGFFERILVSDRVAYLSALDQARHSDQATKVMIRLRVQDDEKRNAIRHFALSLRQRSDGMVLAMIRDRQEFINLQEVAQEAIDRADSLDVAKRRFLAAVSHELRTPLNAIIGFSDMMMEGMTGPFGDQRQGEYVGIIRQSGHHLLQVVNAILDISKIESGTYMISPEHFRFTDSLELCRSMMAGQASAKGVTLRVKAEDGIGEICADQRAVQQILINLVANAVKFTPEGGAVTIGAHRQGRRLQFWVSDNGIGIAAADLETLGKPFMQIRNDSARNCEGAGLGLSIVKGLLALHDGTLAVESALGEGTTVTVTLPVDGPDEKSETEPKMTELRILVNNGTQADHEAFRRSA